MVAGSSSKRLFWVVGAVVLLVVGAGAVAWFGRRSALPPVAAPSIHEYNTADLTPLGAHLQDLDEGRLSVAPPASWQLEPRRKEYLARFVLDRTGQSPLPRITVEVRPADFAQPRDVTRANLPELLAQVRGSMEQRTAQAMKESPQMLVVGNVPCVRYLVRRGFSVSRGSGAAPWTFTGEREVVQTLVGGRIYSVILDAYEGKADDYRVDLFAVVAGLKFPQSATEPKEGAAASGKSATEPAARADKPAP